MAKRDQISGLDFSSVIHAVAESILITDAELDEPGPAIVYVNPAFEKMTGWSSDEIIGTSPRILQGAETDLSVFANLKNDLANGFWEGSAINYRKDGSLFWMEWSITPLCDPAGRVTHYVAVQRDITLRKEAQQALDDARQARHAAERAKANLSRYFAPEIVESLSAGSGHLSTAKRKDLPVLFADIVGFTGMSEGVEPEETLELLREVHGWMSEVIFSFGGSIEGFVGDEVIALFGYPLDDAWAATNALRCANRLIETARLKNAERQKKDLSPVEIGVGLQWGPVVLGDVGTRDFVEFTVVGDTVNTASRLQKATRELHCDLVVGDDLVSVAVAEGGASTGDDPVDELVKYGALPLGGREEPVIVWTPQRRIQGTDT